MNISAQTSDARFLFDPAVRGELLLFVADGQLWRSRITGGDAQQLTKMAGMVKRPVISPDGLNVAFTATIAGNQDVHVLNLATGKITRITHHPAEDVLHSWTDSGRSLLFSSSREHPLQIASGAQNLFHVPATGGLPTRLPMTKAYGGAFNTDGSQLVYTSTPEAFRVWKGYRGGQATPLRILGMKDMSYRTIPGPESNNASPVWLDDGILFLSDRDTSFGIYRYDPTSEKVAAVFSSRDHDIDSFASDGRTTVFSAQGMLWTIANGKAQKISVRLPRADVVPEQLDAAPFVANMALAPDGTSLVIEARGDLFLKSKGQSAVALTNSSGIAERNPVWSPRGDMIAFAADPDGKPNIAVIAPRTGAKPRYLGFPGAGYPVSLTWSADGRKIAYIQHDRSPSWVDVATGLHMRVPGFLLHGARFSWNGDTLFFIDRANSAYGVLKQIDTRTGTVRALTDGMAHVADAMPSADGQQLLVLASLDSGPTVTEYDSSQMLFAANARAMLYRFPLTSDGVPEGAVLTALPDTAGHYASVGRLGQSPVGRSDLKGLDRSILFAQGNRIAVAQRTSLANPFWDFYAGNSGKPAAAPKAEWGYRIFGDVADAGPPNIVKQLGGLLSTAGFHPSSSAETMLFESDGKLFFARFDREGRIKAIEEDQVGRMPVTTDPRKEWGQIFDETVRRFSDFFYDEKMHGADWDAVTARYKAWLPALRSRSDLDYVLTKLASEARNSHIFVSPAGSTTLEPTEEGLGYLGADLVTRDRDVIVAHILTPSPWDVDQSPLSGKAIVGDQITEIDGKPIDALSGVETALMNSGGREIAITLRRDGKSMTHRIVPLISEAALRQRDWVESRRLRVAERSSGRIAYIHQPDTSEGGMSEFVRYFYPQTDRTAVIIDERYNGGGADLDYPLDTLGRQRFLYYTARGLKPFEAPTSMIGGPKVMIVNEEAGSGGDVYPYQFKQRGLGSVIGTRTWGGANGGYRGGYPTRTIDGGSVSVPDLGTYSPIGEPILENSGFTPDQLVADSPADDAQGVDTQLEAAIDFLLDKMKRDADEITPKAFFGHIK